jgi:hypothetical protein
MKKKTDRQKQMERFEKACEEAKTKRTANRCLREGYRDDPQAALDVRKRLISDLIRVYNSPDNPWAGWAASRKRYRELGWYPEIIVTDLFGTHEEFSRAAGLRDKRGTSKVKLVTARLSTEKRISDYATQSVERHYGKWDRETRKKQGVKTVLVASDCHGQFVDPFAMAVLLDVVQKVEPDGVVLNGDVVDFPKVGRFTQIPGAGNLSLQAELDFVRDHIIKPVSEICPKAYKIWLMGNHEQRLIRYIADTAPELADLRALRWDQLTGVDEMGWELVFGGNWLAPMQKDRTENVRRTWKILHDCFVVTHGRSIAKNAMDAEISRYGMSGTSGHTHRPGVWTMPTLAGKNLCWTSTGMMAGAAVGKDYVSTPSAWTMGFAVFTIDPKTKTVIPHLVNIYEDFAEFAGKIYRPTKAAKKVRRKQWEGQPAGEWRSYFDG